MSATPYLEAFHARGHTPDAAQLAAIARLDELRAGLGRAVRAERALGARLRALVGAPAPRRPVRGVYLWGGVGRGKTFLLDTFCTTLDVPWERLHFHRFMQATHARLTELREGNVTDPLERIAAETAARIRVLCFDELFVSDIADAMLLGGLFGGLVARGISLVITSNSPPSGLYPDGLQRSRFLPAIALLEQATTVVEVDAGTDYRLRALTRAPLYFVASGADAQARLDERFRAICGHSGTEGGAITVEGRQISLRRHAPGVAWFGFADLCEGPRSALDYIELARLYHTLCVSDIPVFTSTREDAARRFVALVDELYERGVKLVATAAAEPADLYRGERLAAEFRRTVSRLTEMQSHEYLARPHSP